MKYELIMLGICLGTNLGIILSYIDPLQSKLTLVIVNLGFALIGLGFVGIINDQRRNQNDI